MNDWNEPDFEEPHLDHPNIGVIRYIGEDKAVVERSNGDVHWSELPKPVTKAPDFPSWWESDNDAKSPLEQDLE